MQEKLAKGTRVSFSGEGEIVARVASQNGITYSIRVGGEQQWTITLLPGTAKIRRLTPEHTTLVPGQLWQADGIMWMAQLRREDLPLRLSPQDMSTESGRKTLDEDTFFQTYPDAVLVYYPSLHPESEMAIAPAAFAMSSEPQVNEGIAMHANGKA